MSSRGQTSNIQILTDLSSKINEIKGNIPYNKLVENTKIYLNNKYKKRNNKESIIKNNFSKYINILEHLYKYYIYYEYLLTKYKGDKNQFNDILKQLYKKKISNNSDDELNAEKIRNKIIDILDKKKQKVRKLLDNLTEKIMKSFKSLSEENYNHITNYKNKNKSRKIEKLLSMYANIKKKNENETLLFNKLKKYIENSKPTNITNNNISKQINFSKAKTKQNYLNRISSSISQQKKYIISKINNDFKKSLKNLNKIKENANNTNAKAKVPETIAQARRMFANPKPGKNIPRKKNGTYNLGNNN
jgi:hypothetical protein